MRKTVCAFWTSVLVFCELVLIFILHSSFDSSSSDSGIATASCDSRVFKLASAFAPLHALDIYVLETMKLYKREKDS